MRSAAGCIMANVATNDRPRSHSSLVPHHDGASAGAQLGTGISNRAGPAQSGAPSRHQWQRSQRIDVLCAGTQSGATAWSSRSLTPNWPTRPSPRPPWQTRLVGAHHLVQMFRDAGKTSGGPSPLTSPWLRHVQLLAQAIYNTERVNARLGTQRRITFLISRQTCLWMAPLC